MKTILFILTGSLLANAAVKADDWPGWFGPQRDGVWREKGIVKSFPKEGPEVLWRAKVNRGYAGPAVAGGRVFIMDRKVADSSANPDNPFARGQIPGNERLVCIDAGSGKVLWEKAYDCPYTISYAAGPRATPLIEEDRVYTLGAEGNLICRRVTDGQEIWTRDFNGVTGAKTPTWGFTATPVIHDKLLICLAAGEGSIALALDKMTGREQWRALSAKEPGYAPPVIVNHGGRQLLIIWHPEAANALDPETGKLIWTIPWKLRFGLSVSTPQLVGDTLYFSSFYNGSMALGLKKDAVPEILWRTEKESEKRTEHLHGIMNTAVIAGGHIYGACSYGEFRCLELKSGKRLWESLAPVGLKKPTRWGTVFVTPHQDRYFLFSENGDLAIAELSPKGYREISRANIIEPNGLDMRQRKIVWSHPAYAMRSCFVRNDTELIRVSLAAQ
jgi:outer membrane protein assembly factor BamB